MLSKSHYYRLSLTLSKLSFYAPINVKPEGGGGGFGQPTGI